MQLSYRWGGKNRSDKYLPSITDIQLLLPQSGGMDRMICGRIFHPCFTEVPTVVYNYYSLLLLMSCMFLFVWVCFIYHLWTLHSALHWDPWMQSEQWSPSRWTRLSPAQAGRPSEHALWAPSTHTPQCSWDVNLWKWKSPAVVWQKGEQMNSKPSPVYLHIGDLMQTSLH